MTPSLLNFSVVLRQEIVQNYSQSQESESSDWKFNSLYKPKNEVSKAGVPFLIQLSKLYEKGEVTGFFNFFDKNEKTVKQDNLLEKNKELLVRKIRVVSLCDTIFFSQSSSNSFSFQNISSIVGIPLEDVEPLIIHVLSIKLLTGHIDENNEQLIIDSIKPRELDSQRLVQLKNRYDFWQSQIGNSLDFIKNT